MLDGVKMFDGRGVKELRRIYDAQHLERCPQCAKKALVEDSGAGQTFCSACGFVVQEKGVDPGPEWRAYTGEEGESRSRAEPAAPFTGDLSTVIGRNNVDAKGRGVDKTSIGRLRIWDSRSPVSPRERNLREASLELNKLVDNLGLRALAEDATDIYRRVLDRDLVRGRSIKLIVTSSLYAACRKTQNPRTLKDLAGASNLKKGDVARAYRIILKEMDIRIELPSYEKGISRVASAALVSEKTKRRALEILKLAEEKGMRAGKAPMGMIAGALYVACTLEGESRTQAEIAEAAGVTEVTVRNRSKPLREALGVASTEEEQKAKRAWREEGVDRKAQGVLAAAKTRIREASHRLGVSGAAEVLAQSMFDRCAEVHRVEGWETARNLGLACLYEACSSFELGVKLDEAAGAGGGDSREMARLHTELRAEMSRMINSEKVYDATSAKIFGGAKAEGDALVGMAIAALRKGEISTGNAIAADSMTYQSEKAKRQTA